MSTTHKMTNKSTWSVYTSKNHVIVRKWENPDYVLYPDGDPDHSQNSMGSDFDQDPSSIFLGRSNQKCLCNPAYKQKNRQMEIKIIQPWRR